MMNSQEKRATFGLAGIFAFRMLGLFMILPVFSLYAHSLKGSTPFLIGLAIGIYGLTQAILQIPFGMLSDKVGRKPVILAGLIIFGAGSLIAALSHNISGVIIGRALQGAGAIGSTIIAFLSDLTHDDNRTKAMAGIGMCIGLSFTAAIILGPVLNSWVGVQGIFGITLLFAFIAIIILYYVVPSAKKVTFHSDSEPLLSELPNIITNKALLQLDLSVFIQHCLLTANFVVIPIVFSKMGISSTDQTWLYLPILVLAFIISVPLIIIAEKRKQIKTIMMTGVIAMLVAEIGFWGLQKTIFGFGFMLWLFFTAFCALEALLPSLISKTAPIQSKGTATGVYSTSQFLGIFFGGIAAGSLYQHYHITDVFWFNILLIMLWLLVISKMPKIHYWSTKIYSIKHVEHLSIRSISERLKATNGVKEIAISKQEHIVYLKIDKDIFNESELQWLTT